MSQISQVPVKEDEKETTSKGVNETRKRILKDDYRPK